MTVGAFSHPDWMISHKQNLSVGPQLVPRTLNIHTYIHPTLYYVVNSIAVSVTGSLAATACHVEDTVYKAALTHGEF